MHIYYVNYPSPSQPYYPAYPQTHHSSQMSPAPIHHSRSVRATKKTESKRTSYQRFNAKRQSARCEECEVNFKTLSELYWHNDDFHGVW